MNTYFIATATRKNLRGKPPYTFVYKHADGSPVFFETHAEAFSKARSLCADPAHSMYDPYVFDTLTALCLALVCINDIPTY